MTRGATVRVVRDMRGRVGDGVFGNEKQGYCKGAEVVSGGD